MLKFLQILLGIAGTELGMADLPIDPVCYQLGRLKAVETSMKYHLVSVALIGAALVLYMSGAMDRGTDFAAFLIVAGFSCEFLFWTRIFRTKARRRSKTVSG
jgi:hypothetical protein